ncbi:unnamed protein product [Paramecium pentaurelia]|uniref:Uncharacterized protein n=1 Tax=Paramecium pentaurelia TaxID=43138 RepID=A0A8S1SCY6_9CILI|nr:unnamed protein product [Paramecium pentaurelia]
MTSIYEKLRPVVFQAQPISQQRSASQSMMGVNCSKQFNTSGEVQNYFMQCRKNVTQQHQTTREKENTLNVTSTIKKDEITFLKQRITQLEKMNSHQINENNKLSEIIQKYMENEKLYNKSQLSEIQYQSQIQELEKQIVRLQNENQVLLQNKEQYDQIELDKYKTKCYLLQNKVKQFQEEKRITDLQKKGKKLYLENQQLKSTIEYLQSENSTLQQQLLTKNVDNPKFNQKDQKLQLELQSQIKYMTQIIDLDQIKMKNLEEKVELLNQENRRLQEITKEKMI